MNLYESLFNSPDNTTLTMFEIKTIKTILFYYIIIDKIDRIDRIGG